MDKQLGLLHRVDSAGLPLPDLGLELPLELEEAYEPSPVSV